MALEIINPGPLSTVQDGGRKGYMQAGFPRAGVMDDYSFYKANALLHNDPNAAVIEMTMLGVKAKFTAPCRFVAAGGDFGGMLNDTPIRPNTVYQAAAGDLLSFGAAKSGCRCYLAVKGGFDVPMIMGSRSTDIKCRLGGVDGRKLQKGDLLPICPADTDASPNGASFHNPMPQGVARLRAVPGPQDDAFTADDLALFFSQPYTVTAESDRMGMKLDGAPLQSKNGMDIISDGIAFGAVQVPRSGKPIVLMADRQTVGGYAKIATVLTCDLHIAAQLRPADRVQFVKTDLAAAQAAAVAYRKTLYSL